MRRLSLLCIEGIIHDLDILPFMYYDLPTQDSDQLDLPISPYGKFYIKFAHLHLEDDPQMIIRTERERLKTLYSLNTPTQKGVWSRKRTTKIYGFGRKVLTNFDLDYLLHRFYVYQNKKTQFTITNAVFPLINPNGTLAIATHF